MGNLKFPRALPETISTHSMKKILLFILLLTAGTAVAQPPARIKQQLKVQTTQPEQRKASVYREFPTAARMPETVVWRRDVYRELDLTKDANATLYFPQTAQADGRENLFNYLFKLILRKQITAYDYKLDGKENFEEKNALTPKDIMKAYKIRHEEKDGRFRVSDADIPCQEVKSYFIKESIYFDQNTAQFSTRVVAICPVLHRAEGTIADTRKLPMFWLNYDDVAPWLGKLMLMGSNFNNAATLSANDFFTLARYEGDIYSVTNLQDRIISDYCANDSAVKVEQARIEKELSDFEKRVWRGDSIPPAATEEEVEPEVEEKTTPQVNDSTQAAVEKKTAVKRRTAGQRAKTTKKKVEKKEKKKSTVSAKRSTSPSSSGGLSVRRQRR